MSVGAGDKVMFEVYRVAGSSAPYRAVYFTELDEHERDEAIAEALAGEPLVDGFLREEAMPEARARVDALLLRLNAGEALSADEIARALSPFLA